MSNKKTNMRPAQQQQVPISNISMGIIEGVTTLTAQCGRMGDSLRQQAQRIKELEAALELAQLSGVADKAEE